MHDNIEITTMGNIYTPIKIRITPTWVKNGDIASVVALFEEDTLIRANGLLSEFTGKDYNDDYNPDYNI